MAALDSVDAWDAADCRPGAGTGTLARLGRVLLLVGSSDPAEVGPLLDQARTVAANGGQGRQLVRGFALMLATAADEGPAFVAMAPHGTGLALFVQGDATVTVGDERVSGADSLAWVEKLVPWPVDQVVAAIDGQPAATDDASLYTLGAGVVPAGSVTLRAAGDAPPEPVDVVALESRQAMPAPVTPDPPRHAAPGEPAPEPAPPAAEPPPPWPEPAVGPTPVVEVPEPTPPPAPAPPAEPATPAYPAAPAAEVPVPAAPPAPAAPAGRPVPAPVADEHVSFDSVLLSDVAVDDDVPAPLPIVSEASEVPSAQPDAADVKGVFCKNHHFNDPRQLFCAVCGINMVQQTPVLVDGKRPPLGVIVLDDGSVFQLDTAYLLGRDPEADPRVGTGEFRSLPIIDQSHQVSRVHARLELRGWDVVLTDNTSTNGTFVHVPKTPDWQRLPPGGELVLTQGTRVRIGHRTLAFNTHAGQ